MTKIQKLHFQPVPGLRSKHLQTIIAAFRSPGIEPESRSWIIELEDNDRLCCELSTPPNGKGQTVVLVHGLGGSYRSPYMIRMARKFYSQGIKVLRVNLRGSGTGAGLSKRPYNAGNSHDLLQILKCLKQFDPASEVTLIGFSLGGNMVLKLAGELKAEASKWVKRFIAVCAPLDLRETVRIIEEPRNRLYHYFYLKEVCQQGRPWMKQKIRSLYDFDDKVTAPLWGYRGADEYYSHCSSRKFISDIQHDCHILYAEDDPFIRLEPLNEISVPNQVKIWASKHGGHMGFQGLGSNGFYWMDELLLSWVGK